VSELSNRELDAEGEVGERRQQGLRDRDRVYM